MRERAAAVLAVAVRQLREADRELCEMALAAAMLYLCNGMSEELSMSRQVSILVADHSRYMLVHGVMWRLSEHGC